MSERVTYECEDGIGTITMDDGKVNVMSTAMLRDLDSALDQAACDAAIVVLRSARARVFSAGFDLKVFAANDVERSLEMVKAGAELALRLLSHPFPTIGILEGHAFPMGTFLLLACDLRIGARSRFRMGLNEVAIGIPTPGFGIELARSRVHPAWLSRTVTIGEMYEPEEAERVGFLDHVVDPDQVEGRLSDAIATFRKVDMPSHATAKRRLRAPLMAAVRAAIDGGLTLAAYEASAKKRSAVILPGRARSD